ncbi:MAG: NAD(P)/FAD-dependent oxidoreductase [Candidatus Eiseniibacteriota bacterium]|jgi:putative flavoprotein involved in K+ transport
MASTAKEIDTLIIGAGQAGLAMSRCLQKHDVEHVVLERGRIGNTWRMQRWSSFHLNTPNAVNLLPDDRYDGEEASGFTSHQTLIAYFEGYCRRHGLPVEEGVEVTAVRRVDDGFEVVAGGAVRRCRNVVLCCGDQNSPAVPRLAERIPAGVTQLHSAGYRGPEQLPAGAVLVVGSGQSGVQIVEDLIESGRTVFLSTSAVGRAPRRYRGKDIFEWMQIAGLVDQRPEDLEDPDEIHAKQPQISGTHGGHTVSLQQLARDGATLLGRMSGVRGTSLCFDGDLEANVARGDEISTRLRTMVDTVITSSGIAAPAAEPDPAEEPFPGIAEMAVLRELDVEEAGISAIIWATGFVPRFDFLDPALLADSGLPRHRDGVGEVTGLYCLGFTWLRRRASGLIAGVSDDAEYIAGRIAASR